MISHNHQTLLAGDFNFPGWNWKDHVVTSCNYPTLHYQFGDILDDKSLTQLIEQPTRNQITLYLVITNNPSCVKNITVLPGISDHDCPLVELDLKSIRYRQQSWQIPIYKRAEELSAVAEKIKKNKDSTTANEMWLGLKEANSKGIKSHIPLKLCKQKDNVPWVTPKIRK